MEKEIRKVIVEGGKTGKGHKETDTSKVQGCHWNAIAVLAVK